MPEKLLGKLPERKRRELVELAASLVWLFYRDMETARVVELRRAVVALPALERAALAEIFEGVAILLELTEVVFPPAGADPAAKH